MNRRRLLLGGGVAAAAAAAAVVSTATPAAAANGDPLTLGASNTASTQTSLSMNTGGDTGLFVTQDGVGDTIEAWSGDGKAVFGWADGGIGVYGQSDTGVAVFGISDSGVGIAGGSASDVGVTGDGFTQGVLGRAINGEGVKGISTNSAGLYGASATGSAVYGEADIGPGLTTISNYANLALAGDPTRLAPTTDAVEHFAGNVVTDNAGNQWVCVAGGTPGTWRKVAGPTSAGTFHLLPTAVRVYDSRSGTLPTVGSKTPLTGNTARLLSVTANSSGVPLGATAISATILLLNASTAGGNFTIWAGGASRPSANAMVWGGTAGRFASTAITRISADGKVNVAASSSADLALDIVGYYL